MKATRADRVVVTGPLAPFVAGFKEYLAGLGYRSGFGLVSLMAELSVWMSSEDLGLAGLSRDDWERFANRRRFASNLARKRWDGSASVLLEYLGGVAGLSAWGPPPGSCDPVGLIIDAYERYLQAERGIAARSVRNYVEVARTFVSFVSSATGEFDLETLSPAAVVEFVTGESGRLKVSSAKSTTTRLRSFLRFLYVKDLTPVSLVGAVPSVASWRLASLPKALTRSQVAALLASCDRRRSIGRRDYAILVVLVRMGLRAGEVARLQLGDIDWRAGDLAVRGKGCRLDRLPLRPTWARFSPDGRAGDGRPVRDRSVFVRMRAPHRGLSPEGISAVVSHACRRVGLPPVCAHRLRHTAATQMLRAGANLREVGQVLRQDSSEVTSIYAKVDRRALSALVRPWPAMGAGQ
jgi:integrase/recombinase XerD